MISTYNIGRFHGGFLDKLAFLNIDIVYKRSEFLEPMNLVFVSLLLMQFNEFSNRPLAINKELVLREIII